MRISTVAMPNTDTAHTIDILKIREIFQNNQNNIIADDHETLKSQILSEGYFDENDPIDDASFPGFSQEERKILINKIMEKKRRDRQKQQQQQQQSHDLNLLNHADLISVSTIAGDENDHDPEDSEQPHEDDSYQSNNSVWEGSNSDSPTNNPNHENTMQYMHNNYPNESNQYSTSSNNINNKHSNESSSKINSSKRNAVITSTPSQKSNNSNNNRNSYPTMSNSASSKSIDNSNKSNSDNNNNQSFKSFQSSAAVLNEMMRECTFTPRIKILPQHYGSANKTVENASFYDRVSKWQRDKDTEVNRKKKETEKNVLSGCTFHPRINRNSEKAVEEIRKIMLKQSISSSNDKSDDEIQKMNLDNINNCYDRLYKSNEMSLEQRAKFIEDELRRERQEEELQCTFQPHLITDQSKFQEVVPRYIQPQYLTYQARKDFNTMAQQVMQKECTFTPKVKALPPRMVSAQKYLNSNVVDRLTQPMSIEMITRPRSASAGGSGSSDHSRLMQRSMSISSGVGSASDNNNNNSHLLRSVSRGRERNRRSTTPTTHQAVDNNIAIDGSISGLNSSRSTDSVRMLNFNQRLVGHGMNSSSSSSKSNQSFNGPIDSSRMSIQSQQQNQNQRVRSKSVDDAASRQKQLEVFLSRLEQNDLRRTRHIEELKRSTTPTFTPEIDRHSKRIFQERYGNKNGNNNNMDNKKNNENAFLDRMERYLLRKQDNQTRNAVLAISQNKNYTYKPEINSKTSHNLKGRSVYELSFGDLIKKESNQRMLKLRIEQEQLAQSTFHPELNENTKLSKTPSVLRLNEDPSFHLSWQKSRLQNKRNTREIELMKRDLQETEECTFAPTTIDCPEYIKRIAQSMTVIKNAKLQSEKMAGRSNGSINNRSSTGGIETIKPDWK